MDLLSIIVVGLAVILLGVSKAGFGGVGTVVALPLMCLGIPPETALGVLLPLLMAADVVSLSAHRRNIDFQAVFFALPGAILGVLLGAYVIDIAAPDVIGACIGLLAILFAVMALSGRNPDIRRWPAWIGSLFGGISGLTSTLAHAGGPPIHMYFLAKDYAPQVFVATSAGFMAGVNLLKVGPYFFIGTLDQETLMLALKLAPLAIASAFAGVRLARVLSKRTFAIAVNSLMIVAGLKLLFDALI